ncbi:hypothetical protein CDV55_102972 [Aspergillus turcosus]|nr:hypothetical protein CDV55_102972 [Aspergillus turcosus]
MPPISVISPIFLSPASVRLGRLVLDVHKPETDFLDPEERPPAGSVLVKLHTASEAVQPDTNNQSFTAKLAQLVSASQTEHRNTDTLVATERVTTYELSDPQAWFRRAVKAEPVREWIKHAINHHCDIFMIVGYHTMTDARVVIGAPDTAEITTWLKLPLMKALASAEITLPYDEIGHPAFENMASAPKKHHQYHRPPQPQTQLLHRPRPGVQKRLVAIGEQVCALQYLKVRFRWLSSSTLDQTSLEKENQWKIYSNVRGDTADVVQVDVQEDLEIEDKCSGLADPISEWRPDSELPPESSASYVESLDTRPVQPDDENGERTDQGFLAAVARKLKGAIQFVNGVRDNNHAAGISTTAADALRQIRMHRRLREFSRLPRLIAALLGSTAFLIPMLIMVLDPSPKKNIITASVFVVVFAILVAWFYTGTTSEVLAITAAYAAVLVVFVGTNNSGCGA